MLSFKINCSKRSKVLLEIVGCLMDRYIRLRTELMPSFCGIFRYRFFTSKRQRREGGGGTKVEWPWFQ